MSSPPVLGAGIWHVATYLDGYATALRTAQSAHDALAAQRLVQQVLVSSMAAEA
ncbi:hypothetical protein AB0M20_14090 [Actinoplanes sp. NPDC051633]|uniref:hypothetical protein n=1 Tax=Actinoplanes sp. NPDC051633 TaxID=3155670 RepID=UPI00342117BB